MAKKLIILESPGKVEKFIHSLSNDYQVLASMGHVFDLPEKKLSVDIKKDFEVEFEPLDGKEDVIAKISAAAKKADEIFIMTDLDVEGFGIGYNIYRFIFPDHKNVKRATTCEINKKEITKALSIAHDINDDINIVHAYETRRICDRLCGYKTSWLTKQATGGISAGRTQSAGLRIIVEREKEIKNFVPIIYWPIEAELLINKKEKIYADVRNPKPLDISTKDEALKIISVLKSKPIKVSKYEVKEAKANAYPPFITSSLQQSASTILGFSPDRAMKAAQTLYTAGAITYHRTDSLNISADFISAIRTKISSDYSKNYLPSSAIFYKSKSKSAQEAHEAIRPTDITIDSWASSGQDEKKLYELIWRRTVASQMAPAIYERRSAEFSCEKYVLGANGSKELFDGFRKVWTYGGSEDKYLPDLKMGEIVDLIDVKTEEHKTQAPPHYSEASFIKELESVGIGRPATYATIPKTLVARGYITVEKNKNIVATDLGIRVCDFLIAANFCFIDIKFTAELEDKLDDIANGKLEKLTALTEFWERLKSDIENSKSVKKEINKTGHSCPKCQFPLVEKHSKFGTFISCSNYPECKGVYVINENNEPEEKVAKKKEYSDFSCPKCGNKMVKRKSKYGEFLGCEKYPTCKTVLDMSGNEVKKSENSSGGKKKFYKKWKKKK